MSAIKSFFIKYKKQIKQILLLLVICIVCSLIVFGILCAFNVITFNNGVQFNVSLFESLKNHWYGYVIFFFFQVILTILLCFAPGGTTTFIALAVVLFGTNYKSFLVLYLGVIASSVLMDLIGRFGGAKIVKKMFGEEDFNKGEKILKEKGVIYLPCMYLFPLFPDDLLCCIAGISKINFWYHLLIICLCRGIGVATIVFGLELIPYKSFTTPYEYILCISVIIIGVYFVFRFARFLDKKLTSFLKRKENNIDNNKNNNFFINDIKYPKLFLLLSIIESILYISYLGILIYFIIKYDSNVLWYYIVLLMLFFFLYFITYKIIKFIYKLIAKYLINKNSLLVNKDNKKECKLKIILMILFIILVIASLITLIVSYMNQTRFDSYNLFTLIIQIFIWSYLSYLFIKYLNKFITKKLIQNNINNNENIKNN